MFCVGLLVFGVWSTAFADLVDDLAQLYRHGQIDQAFARAQRELGRLEGDPRFDFVYGVAAIDSGHTGEGVFALERVLLAFPEDDRARLELARGYFILQEYARARLEFSRVLARNPPAAVRANIKRFLDRIRLAERTYRASAAAYAEAGMGYDSNVNSAPGRAEFVSPVLGTGTLDASSVSTGDLYGFATVGANLDYPLAPGRSVYASLTADSHINQDARRFDTAFIQGETGLGLTLAGQRLRFGVIGQRFTVNRAAYRDLAGLTVGWRHALDRDTLVFGNARFAHLDYPAQAVRNSNQWIFGGGLTRRFDAYLAPLLTLSAFGGHETAVSDSPSARASAQRALFGGSAGATLTLTPRLALNATVSAQSSRYRGQDPTFLVFREDALYQARTGVTWLISKDLSVKGMFAYYRNDSNISINDYHRRVAQLSLRYEYR